MELGCHQISHPDRRGKSQAVFAFADHYLRVVGNRIVRVDEVEARVVRDAVKHPMASYLPHSVPSDLRHFENSAIDRGRILCDSPANYSEAIGVVLVAMVKQHLDSDTDSQKRLACGNHLIAQYPIKSECAKISHRCTRGADPGQYRTIGAANFLCRVRDLASMAQTVQRVCDAGQIPGLVVDDCNHRI